MIEKLKEAFLKNFSSIIQSIEFNEKSNSYVIRIPHPKNYTQLTIWFDNNITSIGFTTDWHTHPELFKPFNENTEEEIFNKTIGFIEDIINNHYLIAFSSKYGEWISIDPELDLKYKDDDETIEFGHWETVTLNWKS